MSRDTKLVISLTVVALLIVPILYITRPTQLTPQEQYREKSVKVAECVNNYTGESEDGWAWGAYDNVSTEDISKMTGVRESVVNDCLERKQ